MNEPVDYDEMMVKSSGALAPSTRSPTKAVKGLVEQIEALGAKATPRPWKRGPSGIYADRLGSGYVLFHTLSTLGDRYAEIDNEEFVSALVNHWPEIKSALSRLAAAGEALKELPRLQARIDELMLEFCPEDMTIEQRAEWARNQRPVDAAEQSRIDAALTTPLSVSPEGEQKEDTDG
jgi:hypothetical protein